MRYILLLITLFASSLVGAEDLCPVNENIEPDMRIPESYFTKERAEEALERLQGIVSGDDADYAWVAVPNSSRIIEGYILRRDALNAEGVMVDYHEAQFCDFMENQAWWYD